MEEELQAMSNADSVEDVERVLRYFGQRLLGGDPEYPTLSPEITTQDALLITDLMLDVLRRASDDPVAVLQIEADVVAMLASVGIIGEHHRQDSRKPSR